VASPNTGTDTRPDSAPRLQWTVHPAAQDPARAAVLVLVVALAALLAWSFTGSAAVTAAGVALLLSSLAAFFLPRTYVLDERGAAEHGPLRPERRLAWSAVRSVTRERHGVHLSPLYRPSRWTVDRGLFLRAPGQVEDVARFALERSSEPGPA
jgi:hypothetical protein